MSDEIIYLKFLPIKEVFFWFEKKQRKIFLILIKKYFLEVAKIESNFDIKNLFISKFNSKIRNIITIQDFNGKIENLILLNCDISINIIKINENFEPRITSTKDLKNHLTINQVSYTFFTISFKPLVCVLGTTEGTKIFLTIEKMKNNDCKFLKNGTKTVQKSLICYFLVFSGDILKKWFFSIESMKTLPNLRFLVFYKHDKGKIVKKKIFSKIDETAYLIIPGPKLYEKGDNLFVLSNGKLSVINYIEKSQLHETFPIKKSKKKYLYTQIISYCFYKGNKKTLFFFINKDGDIFRLSLTFFPDGHFKKEKLKIYYFDTLSSNIKNIRILANGFLNVNFKTGNVLFYRLTRIKNQKKNQEKFFLPNSTPQNLILVNEIELTSTISSMFYEHIFDKYSKQLVFFCGTKNKSSFRLLERISNILSISKKLLFDKPMGIYMILNCDKNVHFFISFKYCTLSYLIGKKIEEINQLWITSDIKTISIVDSIYLGGIIQVTERTVKLIKSKNGNRKIYQWVLNSGFSILKFDQNIHSRPYLFLLLSNNKITLLEFINNKSFMEIKNWNFEKIEAKLFIFKSYISNEPEEFKYLILGTKKERTIRVYKIFSDFSILLIGIHILNWSPESLVITKNNLGVYFLICQNNGILVKVLFYPKLNKTKLIGFRCISEYPLYFSDNFSFENPIVFGDKIWRLKNISDKKIKAEIIYEKSFDLFELLGNILIGVCGIKLECLFLRKEDEFCLNKTGYFYNFSIRDSCFFKKKKKSCVLVINKNNIPYVSYHEMNLFLSIKERNFKLKTLHSKENNRSSVSLIEIYGKLISDKKKSIRLNDLFFLETSSGNCFFESIVRKKSFFSDKSIILLSKIVQKNYAFNSHETFWIKEYCNQSISLIATLLDISLKFCPIKGGEYNKTYKLNFLFENINNFGQLIYSKSSLCNFFIGSRLIICLERSIRIMEISLETFKHIFIINIPSLNFKKLQTSGNRIYFLNVFQGIKVITIDKKGKVLCLNLIKNFSVFDFVVLDPIHILTIDIFQKGDLWKVKNKGILSVKKKDFNINNYFFLKKLGINVYDEYLVRAILKRNLPKLSKKFFIN